jgi:hypothetical protein
MIEFLQNYGLWIVLGGVFLVMHRFGMGCCGGHHQRPPQRDRALSGEVAKDEKTSEASSGANRSCH